MPYCSHCGTQVQTSDLFCRSCGRPLANQSEVESAAPTGAEPASERATPPVLFTAISTQRVALMTVISYGLYLFYWFYMTWKQYRDYTKKEAYPVWHAMTLSVPIYGLFRAHAHVRTYKELATSDGIPTSLSPCWAVAGVAVSSVLEWASSLLALASSGAAVASAFLEILAIAIVAVVLVHVQRNLNAYWKSVKGVNVAPARTSVSEIAVGILGAFSWFLTIGSVAGII